MVSCFPVSLVKNSTIDVSEPVLPPKKSFCASYQTPGTVPLKQQKRFVTLTPLLRVLKDLGRTVMVLRWITASFTLLFRTLFLLL